MSALPAGMDRTLQATATLSITEVFNEGAASANDDEAYPFAQILEAMDQRTCFLCASVDGMIMPIPSPEYEEWRQPSHVGCRRIMSYISRDEVGVKATFVRPSDELIAEHGHYHIDPDAKAEFRSPAQPAGRNFIVHEVENPETGETKRWLEWAPWTDQLTKAQKALILDARATKTAEALKPILEKLGITDLADAGQQRQIVLFGLRDRVEGWVTATPSGGPLGDPVSKAIENVVAKAKQGIVARALSAIDEVHGDGALPTIPLDGKTGTGERGKFVATATGKAVRIGIDFKQEYSEFTVAHEVGHFLDLSGMGDLREWTTAQTAAQSGIKGGLPGNPMLDEWRKTVYNSDAIKALPKAATNAGKTLEYRKYLLQEDEIWARSYAQYIATTGKNAAMLDGLRSEQGLAFSTQWEDSDFEPIRAAIDTLFRGLGWLK